MSVHRLSILNVHWSDSYFQKSIAIYAYSMKKLPSTHRDAAPPRCCGLTLTELMVTLAILAVLMAIAAPNFQSFLVRNRLVTGANSLLSAMTLARAESLKQGTRVSVCKTDDATVTNPVCSTGAGNWSQGWIVFIDTSSVGGNKGIIDGADVRLRVFAPVELGRLQAGANFFRAIVFRPNGETEGINNSGGVALGNGTFTLCAVNGSGSVLGPGREIIINLTGRAYIREATCTS